MRTCKAPVALSWVQQIFPWQLNLVWELVFYIKRYPAIILIFASWVHPKQKRLDFSCSKLHSYYWVYAIYSDFHAAKLLDKLEVS